MIGATISHYRITDKLGEGGMGVVYKAEDTKLDRTVALKFLAAHLLNDEEAKARFQREARAAAGLHHPNICPVYEIDEAQGKTFLSMAFIKGESLEAHIEKGPLSLKDALEIGRQIAEGLEAAHEEGVVHRDIKPANVMVDAKGRATIMDFGLAHLTEASRLTKADQTMGTVAYMSPEQAQGMEVDSRSDIWALGVVLYEMVRGQRPFQGEYDQALLFEIVHQEVEPLTGVRAGVPMELELIVAKCLAKETQDRYGHADEIAKDLRTLGEKLKSGRSTILSASVAAGTQLGAPLGASHSLSRPQGITGLMPAQAAVLVPKRKLHLYQGLFAVSVVVGLVALAAMYFQQSSTPDLPVRRFVIPSPEEFPAFLTQAATAISPDGKHIAFVTGGEDGRLWIHSFDQIVSRPIPGTEGARFPFWAPDSTSVGFVADRELRRIAVGGGLPAPLCTIGGYFMGGTWSPDGEVIAYAVKEPVADGPSLYEVAAGGGLPSLLIEGTAEGWGVLQPHFLPIEAGPRVLVYLMGHVDQKTSTMVIEDLKGDRRVETTGGHYPFYSPSGHLVYEQYPYQGNLWAAPFSLRTLDVTGEPFPIVDDGHAASISSDGTLVYVPSPGGGEHELVWVNRRGERIERTGLVDTIFAPALSPDERLVAYQDATGNVGRYADVRVYDLVQQTGWRVTSDPRTESRPVWSPDGEQVLFSSNNTVGADKSGIFLRRADGGGPETTVLATESPKFATDWSQDSGYVVYESGHGRGADVGYLVPTEGGDGWESHSFLETPFQEQGAMISPDGQYVAYVSDESGRFEVYVQPFPEGGRRRTVSTSGGRGIRWRRDGKELFYVRDGTLIAVPVSTSGEFTAGQAEPLFEHAGLLRVGAGYITPYDVSKDGQRFLLTEPATDSDSPEVSPASIHVFQNWYAAFRDGEQ